MPKMQLTEAEAALVLAERERLELEHRDWSKEPFITQLQLVKMTPIAAHQLITSRPTVWVPDYAAFIWRNTKHPDNAEWCARREAERLLNESCIKVPDAQ